MTPREPAGPACGSARSGHGASPIASPSLSASITRFSCRERPREGSWGGPAPRGRGWGRSSGASPQQREGGPAPRPPPATAARRRQRCRAAFWGRGLQHQLPQASGAAQFPPGTRTGSCQGSGVPWRASPGCCGHAGRVSPFPSLFPPPHAPALQRGFHHQHQRFLPTETRWGGWGAPRQPPRVLSPAQTPQQPTHLAGVGHVAPTEPTSPGGGHGAALPQHGAASGGSHLPPALSQTLRGSEPRVPAPGWGWFWRPVPDVSHP